MTPDEVEREIEDLRDDFEERKDLRSEALDMFLKIEPKMLIADEALYREMRTNYRDYFRGGMGAESVRDLLDDRRPRGDRRRAPRDHQDRQGPEAREGRQAPEGRRGLPAQRQRAAST